MLKAALRCRFFLFNTLFHFSPGFMQEKQLSAELDGGELTFMSVEVKYKGNMYD